MSKPEIVSVKVNFAKADYYRLEWYAAKTGITVGKVIEDAVNGLIDGSVRRAVAGEPEKGRAGKLLSFFYEIANPLIRKEEKDKELLF